MTNTCGSCTHWLPPSERTGFRSAVSPCYGADIPDEERETINKKADMRLGECSGVPFLPDAKTVFDTEGPVASIRDASEYQADLFTSEDFFCALWAAKST
jgi:hypothetical protein